MGFNVGVSIDIWVDFKFPILWMIFNVSVSIDILLDLTLSELTDDFWYWRQRTFLNGFQVLSAYG